MRIAAPRPPFRVQLVVGTGEAFDLISEAESPRRLARLSAVQGGLQTALQLAAGAEALAALAALLPHAKRTHVHSQFTSLCGTCEDLRWAQRVIDHVVQPKKERG
jgi:hypothetical protein